MLQRRHLIAALSATTLGTASAASGTSSGKDGRLNKVFEADRVWNGVTTTRSGRVFVTFTQADRPGPQLEELDATGKGRPFPDTAWNAGSVGGDVANRFVQINSLRIGPDGALWFVDAGAAAVGKPAVAGGARLFRVDLATDKITRIYAFDTVTSPQSFVDDFRFHGNLAYLTDAGQPGLIVLDLVSGRSRRVLDKDPSTIDGKPLIADGAVLADKDGKQVRVHADQLEVSPDGATLYFQPASGPISRIATRWLDDPSVAAEELATYVEKFVDVPTTGGTAIDANGIIYVGDEEHRRILRVAPDGGIDTLIADERLIWADAMWIDADSFLWIPTAQINRAPGMNRGLNAVYYPVVIYKMKLGVGPSPIDHG